MGLLAAVVLASGANAGDPLGFVFDGGFRGSPCLRLEFSRPAPTVNADGSRVGPGQARMGREETIAGAPEFELVRKTGGAVQVLGSGLCLDGQTPMLVTYEPSGAYVDVFTVAGSALLDAEKTGIGRIRTAMDRDGPDLMQGAKPGKRFEPAAAVVCHGVVVVFCAVRTEDLNGQWRDSSVAFVTSVDEGRTWSLLYQDTPVQPGQNRAREWSMQNWWPTAHGGRPTEAFIAAADYRGNPGSTGGRFYIMRLSRPDADSPWTLEMPQRMHEEISAPGQHFHTGAVVPTPYGGLRALVAVGDGQSVNRIIGLTRPDHAYATPGWVVNQTYHGSMGEKGTMGNQFCGSAPGPRLGDVIAGSDLNDEQLMLLTVDGADGHPKTAWLYGRSWVDGRRSANFVVRTPFPETGRGPYISKYDPHKANEDALVMPRRGLFSPDGIHWAQAFAPGAKGSWTIGLHGNDIYFGRGGVSPAGLLRTPAPVTRTLRPLPVGPGAVQRLVPEPAVSSPPGAVEALKRAPNGFWMDNGVPLDPQPPSSGPVYRCRASVMDATSRIGEFKVCGGAADVGDVLGTDSVQVRCWVRNLQDSKSARPNFIFGPAGGPTISQSTTLSATDAWMSIDIVGRAPLAPGQEALLSVRSGGAGADDADFYLAFDRVAEGDGFPGFASAPDVTFPPVGVITQDELAKVTGFECGPKWTITLAAQVPQDGWDQSMTGVAKWPLCTLWGGAGNYVTLLADPVEGRLKARVIRGGEIVSTLTGSELFWLRGSSVLVSLADDGSGVRMTLSAAGLPVEEAQADAWASPAVPPREIRLGDPTGQGGNGAVVRVTPMEWFGGRIDTSTALDPGARRALLTGLPFLDRRMYRSADLDGDGQPTIFDFLMFVNLFIAADPDGDFDDNGEFDLFDFLAFQNAFASPCG